MQSVVPRPAGPIVVVTNSTVKSGRVDKWTKVEPSSDVCREWTPDDFSKYLPIPLAIAGNDHASRQSAEPVPDLRRQLNGWNCDPVVLPQEWQHESLYKAAATLKREIERLAVKGVLPILRNHTDADQLSVS